MNKVVFALRRIELATTRRASLLFLLFLAFLTPLVARAEEFSYPVFGSGSESVGLRYSGPLVQPIPETRFEYNPLAFGGNPSNPLSPNFEYLSPEGTLQWEFQGETSGWQVELYQGGVLQETVSPGGERSLGAQTFVEKYDSYRIVGPEDSSGLRPQYAAGNIGSQGGSRTTTKPETRPAPRGGQGRQGFLRTEEESTGLIPCTNEPCRLDELIELAVRIFNWLLALGGIVALLAVIVAGTRYLIAVFSADSGTMASAKENLTYAIIGLAVLLLAFVIVRTIYVVIFEGKIPVPGLN